MGNHVVVVSESRHVLTGQPRIHLHSDSRGGRTEYWRTTAVILALIVLLVRRLMAERDPAIKAPPSVNES